MHDALRRSYESDTLVVDVDERPARPRARTEELTMQVHHEGDWHRRTPDLATTACGLPVHSQFAPVRREELRHPLCRTCFTPFELAKADVRANGEAP